jgi:hypothetical protein
MSTANYPASTNADEIFGKQTEKSEPAQDLGQLKSNPQPTLTRGQQVMSVSFNPGQREDVAAIKQIFADAFDEITKWVNAKKLGDAMLSSDQERDVNRLEAIAKTNLETAQMYAVKAITR